jgi:hypothetical protein
MDEKLREKMIEIEQRLGGPVAAARAAGVRYPTWYRWRVGTLQPSTRTMNLVDLLLKISSPQGQN